MRFVVIGNPGNRRVTQFCAAVTESGRPSPEVVSYRSLLASDEPLRRLDDGPAVVRQDAAGEDFEVARGLLHLGYDAAVAAGVQVVPPERIEALQRDRGRVLAPRQEHLGFLRLNERIAAVCRDRPRWRVLQPADGIALLFDKRRTARQWADQGIAVPEAVPAPRDLAHLREICRERDRRSVYIKLSCGSSASCLALYDRLGRAGERLTTTLERDGPRLYNSLRLRHYTRERDFAFLVEYLLREGAQTEVAVPKAKLGGWPFDLRWVIVDGEIAFRVVRQSRHPITNLHLGGWRGEVEAAERALGPERLAAAERDALQAAASSGCFTVGVDVLVEAGFRGHRILEGNAFGDLLPRLERDGWSVYRWQVERAGGAR